MSALEIDGVMIERLIPIVESEVRYILAASVRGHHCDLHDVQDFVQEVLVNLLDRDAKTLRSWDPARGRSLESFVRLVARRRVASIFRRRSRKAWALASIADSGSRLTAMSTSDIDPEHRAADLQRLERILGYLDTCLDTRGKTLLRSLCVEELTVEDVCAKLSISREAVYAWRFRLRRMVRQFDTDGTDEAGLARDVATTATQVG